MSSTRFAQLSPTSKAYVSTIVAAGAVTVLHSVHDLATADTPRSWLILAVLTLISGSATIKLPALPATITVSETFVFTSVLLFGSAAGTLTVALDALVISFWSYRKGHPFYKIVFNLFALPLTIWIASKFFFFQAHVIPFGYDPDQPFAIKTLLFPLFVLALSYFSLNSWIIAFAIALERKLPAYRIWRENFAWLSLNYFGGASVSVLLVSYTRNPDYGYLALILPLIVVLYFTFSTSMGRVADANQHLKQLNVLYMSTIETLAMAIDAKDQITHGHIRRVQTYAIGLAQRLGVGDVSLIRAVEAAALLHDMGKLAVPEYILNKPGPLTPAEFEKMKLHASVGADILSAIDFPYPVVPIVRHHHENWNGTGYPDGLSGADIPIGARILSVVDCFDALTSDRPYRPRLSDREAIAILLERRGSMYDPIVVDTFIRVHAEIAPSPSEGPRAVPLRAIAAASADGGFVPASATGLDEISGSTEEMLTLFDLARGLTSQMSVADAGDVITKHLRRLIPCSLCVFYLYEVDSDELVAAHATGENANVIAGLRVGVGQRLSGWVAAHRQTIRNSDPILDFGDAARSLPTRPMSCLSTPMMVANGLVGVLSLYATGREAFSDEHQRILEVVSRQVSAIIKNAAQFESARVASMRDSVTGLPNIERLKQVTEPNNSDLLSYPVTAILVRVEYLQGAGRPEEHGPRERLFGAVAKATRQSLRSVDLLFRSAPEELVALLLKADPASSTAIANRLRSNLAEIGPQLGNNEPSVRTTVIASPLHQDAVSIDSFLKSFKGDTDSFRPVNVPSKSESIH
jgi:putative nucleotidyltransferase with HDIG domain